MGEAIAGELELNLEPESLAALREVGLIAERARLLGDEEVLSAAGSVLYDFPESLERVPGDLHGLTATGAPKLTCLFKIKESLLARMLALRALDR
ncbi:MAG: hypothetical protein NUV75_01765 [Gallionella sp.]|nr:hypothetical protein [Gallionella sp.]